MKIGFIGLGNVGAKLANCLIRNGYSLLVKDLNEDKEDFLKKKGAEIGKNPKEIAQNVDILITCLPSPDAVSAVMEGANGVIEGIKPGFVWAEMSTTDESEVRRIGDLVLKKGGEPMDCPVSGGCHRAATGNISIFVGSQRSTFDRCLPILTTLGGKVLHTGKLGSASILKVITNYLASINLAALGEGLMTASKNEIDLNTAFEAIRISSGNSFVHETESQLILNGSRNINFTLDLVVKDLSLFQSLAEKAGIPLELSPLLLSIFKDGLNRYGGKEWSSNIVRRLEDSCDTSLLASGFPDLIIDEEPEKSGHEVTPRK